MKIGPHEVDPTPIAPGGGALGVYRGVDGFTGQGIAVKLLGEHARADPVIRSRFQAEFALLESFEHPFSATGYRWDDDAERGAYFTMPFYTDGDWVEARRNPTPSSLGILLNRWVEVVSVLMAAHQRGLLHRDLKPSNILLPRGKTRVADWGIGRPVGLSAAYTQTNDTPGWRPPEQAGGITGVFTDVWGLAGLIGWILTGERPTDLAADIPGVLWRSNWPDLVDFFERGLAESQADRFETVGTLVFATRSARIKRALWDRSNEPITDRARIFWPWRVHSGSPHDNLQPRGLFFHFHTRNAAINIQYAESSEIAIRVMQIGPRLLREANAHRDPRGVWRIQSDSPPFQFQWIHGQGTLSKRLDELAPAYADAIRDFFFLAEDRIESLPSQFHGAPDDK